MLESQGNALPPLVVDDREKDHFFLRELGNHFTMHKKHLATGDYVWSCPLGSVGVERKSSADLDASHSNKRLDDELRRLVESYAVPVLFITGRSDRREEATIENTKLGRQLHGVYVYHVGQHSGLHHADAAFTAAEGLHRLWKYTTERLHGATDGVRRERKLAFLGPLGPRADVIYSILGSTPGVRNRRAIALSISQTTPLSTFLRWDAWDFEAAGFSRLMAVKLAGVIHNLEEPTSKSLTLPPSI